MEHFVEFVKFVASFEFLLKLAALSVTALATIWDLEFEGVALCSSGVCATSFWY
jgi:hypothetical protein